MSVKKNISVQILTNYPDPVVTKEKFVTTITKKITDSSSGYAGFKTKEYLHKYLLTETFDQGPIEKLPKYKFNRDEIKKIIKKTVGSCEQILSLPILKIFVFPTFRRFIKEKMSGVTGYTPWPGVLLLHINPTTGWKKSLKKIVAHEYNHAVVLKNQKWRTLLDSLIFEGLAEHFQEQVVGSGTAPWAKVLTTPKAKKLFRRIKKLLSSKNYKVYESVFFGGKNYQLWTGYAVGYQIVGHFLKNNPQLTWERITRLKPKEILKRSGFDKK